MKILKDTKIRISHSRMGSPFLAVAKKDFDSASDNFVDVHLLEDCKRGHAGEDITLRPSLAAFEVIEDK